MGFIRQGVVQLIALVVDRQPDRRGVRRRAGRGLPARASPSARAPPSAFPEEVREDYVEVMSANALANDVLEQVGRAELAAEGFDGPTVDQVTQAGTDVFTSWPDANGVEVDPSYGVELVDGTAHPGRHQPVVRGRRRRPRPGSRPSPTPPTPTRCPRPTAAAEPVAVEGDVGGGARSGDALVEFVEVMRRLRAECPWKAEQTHASLARYLLEETHETLEAIDAGEESGDWDHLREELGDLLLQVYFHAAIAEERGEFTIDDVAAGIAAKMRRRNPHVFGEPTGEALTPAQVNDQWQRRKADEKRSAPRSPTASRPACPRCCTPTRCSTGSRARGRHGDRSSARPAPMTSDELGERLLGLVREARAEGVDPEQALRDAVRREVDAAAE